MATLPTARRRRDVKQRLGTGAAVPGAIAVAGSINDASSSNDMMASKERLTKGRHSRNTRDASHRESNNSDNVAAPVIIAAVVSTSTIANGNSTPSTLAQPGAVSMTALEGSIMSDKAHLKSMRGSTPITPTLAQPGAVSMTALEGSFMSDKARLKNMRAGKRSSDGLASNPAMSIDRHDSEVSEDDEYDEMPSSARSMALADTYTNEYGTYGYASGDDANAATIMPSSEEQLHVNNRAYHDASPQEEFTPTTDADFVVLNINDGDKKKTEEKSLCSRTRWIILAAIVLLIVVGGAIGGVLAGGGGGSDSEQNEVRGPARTTIPPTSSPVSVVAPTVSSGELLRWMDVITTASPNTSFDDPTTSSSLALEWMQSDPYSADLEDDPLLQRFALVTLWYSTDGPNWRMSPTWLDTGGSECDWEGVSSCSGDGVILDLSLVNPTPGSDRSFNLVGPIPIELGLLSSLESLDLSKNGLTGTVPTELAQLTSSHTLQLRRNSLDGTIPTEFGNLSLMKLLFLSYNQLEGTIPTELLQLADLEQMALDSNLLEGPILIGQWSKLIALGLSVNKLTGTIPSEIGTLTLLQNLFLGLNNYDVGVVRLPSELGHLTLLNYLSVNDAGLSFPIPMEIGALAALDIIDLAGNQLSGPIPAEFGNLTVISRLSLERNQLTGPIPSELGALTLLLQLLLSNNFLNGSMPQTICDTGMVRPEIDCREVECSCCKGISGNTC